MRLGVVGTGYVGLVSGTCFAERGNDVTCIDIDANKVERLSNGEVPIFEPGLEDIFNRNIREGRLHFSTDLNAAIGARAIFLALPTPPGEDGSADLSYILDVADDLGRKLTDGYSVVVDKSTVPVGTAEKVRQQIAKHATAEFDVVSNPEFLREGQAVADFMKPDRVVIGSSSERATKIMTELYRPFVRRQPDKLIVTNPESAELIKYAANALLATKISFINGLTSLAEEVGADINDIRLGIGSDQRIGSQFLYPGPGYGGSCFPKDTLALVSTAREHGLSMDIVEAAIAVNERQKHAIPDKILNYYQGNLEGKTFALWGLAFKRDTDDIRESPAVVMMERLTEAGAHVVAFDPQAMENVRQIHGTNQRLRFAKNEYEAADGADALVIATEWNEFFAPDFDRLKGLLKEPVIFDGRNMYDLDDMQQHGFYYQSIGRRVVSASQTQ